MATLSSTYRFDVRTVQRMIAAGILREDERLELLDGTLTVMTPIAHRHVAAVNFLTNWLAARVRERAIVQVQSPVYLDAHNAPQPDVALLRPAEDYYRAAPAAASDVLLVIEVADTNAAYDREKLALYARAGVPEVWIVDLAERLVEVSRAPRDGLYRQRLVFQAGDLVAPEAFTDLQVPVAGLV